MRDWLLTRRDFLKSSGLMFIFPWTGQRRPRHRRTSTTVGLLLLLQQRTA
jgi:hypothetical protein